MLHDISEMEIPIIILNWYGITDTEECIRSLLLTQDIKYHIFLVDNASGDEEQSNLRNLYGDHPNITLTFNDTNQGFAKGNNEILKGLIKKDQYQYIVLLNNDTVVTPKWLYNLVKSAIDNNASMVSSKMINYYDRSIMDNAGHFMLNTAEILPLAHGKPVNEYTKSFDNLGACGGAALYEVTMLKKIGIFDEFFSTGYEDAELGMRANMLGYKSIFEPTAKVYHKVSRSIAKVRDDDYFIKIQRNIFYTYLKLMPLSYILINLVWIFLKYVVLFLISLLTLQIRIIKLHVRTLIRFFSKDLKRALMNRRKFFQLDNINTSRVQDISFFLRTDIKRFFQLFKYVGD